MSGAITESLRNIELVKSLGLARQEIRRLQGYTQRIFELEMRKVKKVRSLSVLQGTLINVLRQSILFILLWLIFRSVLSPGELDLLPVHPEHDLRPAAAARERGAQLPRGRGLAAGLRAADGDAHRAAAGGPRRHRRDREPALPGRGLPLPRRGRERDRPRLLRGAARRHHRLRGPLGLRQVDARQAAGRAVHPDRRRHLDRRRARLRAALQPRPPADRLRHPGSAAVLGHDPREPALRAAGRQRRGDAGGPAPGLGGTAAGALGPGTRHAPRRGRPARLGRRAAAPVDRPRPAAPPAALHLRRGHLGARLDHRAGGHGLACARSRAARSTS